MKGLDFKLSKVQKKHHKSIRWLLFDGERLGRTSLLAFVYIEKALKNPGEWIKVRDHYPFKESDSMLLNVILMKIKENKKIKFEKLFDSFRILL